jgi:hypothetical protein
MSVAVGFAVPLANVFAISALSRGSGLGPLGVLGRIVRNPFFIASVSGMWSERQACRCLESFSRASTTSQAPPFPSR